jgi:hypothetical protein
MKYQFKVSTSNPNNGNIVEFDPEAGHNHDGVRGNGHKDG